VTVSVNLSPALLNIITLVFQRLLLTVTCRRQASKSVQTAVYRRRQKITTVAPDDVCHWRWPKRWVFRVSSGHPNVPSDKLLWLETDMTDRFIQRVNGTRTSLSGSCLLPWPQWYIHTIYTVPQ